MSLIRFSLNRASILRSLAIIGALTVLSVAWISPLADMAHDLFAAHMLQHLLVMNGAAILFALGVPASRGAREGGAAAPAPCNPRFTNFRLPVLSIVTSLQLAVLWAWHMPAVLAATHHDHFLHGLMQVSVLAVALAFWRLVLRRRDRPAWHAIFALLITAKVFCLLGATFVFSRRVLHPGLGSPETWGLSRLEDQQLAGLLMISSCAVVYVAVAIVLFARWLAAIQTRDGWRWTRSSDAAFTPR